MVTSNIVTSPLSERRWTNRGKKNLDADRTISYVLNGVTKPNLIKFLRDVEWWLPINLPKSKLRYSKFQSVLAH